MDNMIHFSEGTNRKKWIVSIFISCFLIVIALFWKEETLLLSHRIVIIFVCALLVVYAFYHAFYSAIMNDIGVYCSY